MHKVLLSFSHFSQYLCLGEQNSYICYREIIFSRPFCTNVTIGYLFSFSMYLIFGLHFQKETVESITKFEIIYLIIALNSSTAKLLFIAKLFNYYFEFWQYYFKYHNLLCLTINITLTLDLSLKIRIQILFQWKYAHKIIMGGGKSHHNVDVNGNVSE